MEENKIKIFKKQVIKDDNSFYTENAVLLRFENAGQTRVWIDEQVVLEPGEAFVEGDNNGPGIDHNYQINFIPSPSPPTVDMPKVYAGNRLNVRMFKRLSNAGK